MPLGDPADVDLRGLRAAVYTDMPEIAATPKTADAICAAASALEDAGVALQRDRPPRIEESLGITRDYWARSGSVSWNTWYPSHEHRLGSADDVERNIFEWERLRRTFLAWMENYDVIVCPVAADVAGAPGTVTDVTFLYTLPYSLTGYPAAVVRAGATPDGMPIGVQLIARPWREDVAIAAACAVETALVGWQPPAA
jgi:amidase